uniref:PDZ domain-containing protein n=1 Tax=Globisporangium ultimum (strain ATCC 200006 / CBS 805.95 / DAOM BR144) TaxID=431595 RepID=K3XC74_GLOUD
MEPPSLMDQSAAFAMNSGMQPPATMAQQMPTSGASIPSAADSSAAVGGYAPSMVPQGASHQMRPHPHAHQMQQFHPQQQQQPQLDPMAAAYAPHPYARERTPTPPNAAVMHHRPASAGGVEQKTVQLLAACESCLLVVRIPGYDMSFHRVMEHKCSRCGDMLMLPQENMEMFILYGHFIPEVVGATIVLSTMVLHPSLRADFVAAVMNELLVPLQTDFVYDIAVPKRRDGLGMSLRMLKGDLVVGGFIDFDDNTESPSVAARIIAVGDVLVAINKKSITSSSFETNIRMLAHAASPVYLTFRRSRPVVLL